MHRLIPDFILQRYAAGETHGHLAAAAMFVDISGFSAMTDALMQHGRHGAEVLAGVMRAAFEPLIRAVYEQGGFVVAQAGDSFTAVFPLLEDGEQRLGHALAAAWSACQRAAARPLYTTAYGDFVVSAKIGLAHGEVTWGILTAGDEQRVAYYFGGPAVDDATEAEHKARPGEIILAPALFDRVLAGIGVEVDMVGTHYRLQAVTGALPPPIPIALPATDLALAARFFPASLLQQTLSGEFRQVTYLFVSLPTVQTHEQLARFMQSVFTLQEQYGGLLKLQFGDKGVHLLLVWGAPVAHENDIARALHFILALQTQTAIPINGGVTHRLAHAGFIGSDLAEEYAAYGRGVNLAARFMTAAPRGEVWLDEQVAHRAQAGFESEYVGEQRFKGFAQPQQVYRLLERRELTELVFDGALVGREMELAALEEFAQPIFSGHFGGVMVVWGEPGVGKSRLVAEFLARLGDTAPTAFQVCLGQCDEILRQSLNPFRYWLKRYFGVSDTQVEARNKRTFNRKLDDLIATTADRRLAEELDRTRSLLGALVGLAWPDSLAEQLDAQARYETTFVGLATLLRAESRQRPLLFLLEDAHWLDDDSQALIPRLVQTLTTGEQGAYPVALVLTARPEVDEPALDSIPRREIRLGGLSRAALADLAATQLGGPAAASLLSLLGERAEGNPFFAEQILRYLREAGRLVETAAGWSVAAQPGALLPDDVQAVLVARLDRLTQEVREAVQTAAVLGREFEVRVLSEMLQDDARLLEKVARATEAAIWAAVTEIRYLFRHALLHEAAYTMQVRARRQALHAVALAALERLYAADLSGHYGELAYHAGQAGRSQPTFDYSLRAGDEAFRSYANAEAVSHYTRALELEHLAGNEQLVHLYRNSGRALELTGRHKDALAHYEALAALAPVRNDRSLELASLLAQARVMTLETPVQDRERGLALAERALALAQELRDRPSEAGALWTLMLAYGFGQQHFEAAIEHGKWSLALARELNLREQIAHTLSTLGAFYPFHGGQWEASVAAMAEAADLWRELGNVMMQADALGVTGINATLVGRHEQAAGALAEALRIRRSIENTWGEAESSQVLAHVYWEQGDYGRALLLASEAIGAGEKSGYFTASILCRLLLGMLHTELGAPEEGLTFCHAALAIGREQDQAFMPWSFGALAWVHLLQGDRPQAETAVAEARQALQQRISFPTEPHFVTLVDGLVALAAGDWARASATADELAGMLAAMRLGIYVPDAGYLKGEALLGQGHREEARQALAQARADAEAMGSRRILWPILFTLSRLTVDRGEAGLLLGQAQETVRSIADHIDDSRLRASFLSTQRVRTVMQATKD